MAYKLGQKLIHIGKMAGKPPIAYVVGEPDGYIIFLSDGPDGKNRFPVHQAKIKKEWKDAGRQKRKAKGSPEKLTGKQGNMFPQPKTVREIWRDKMIKK